MLHAPAPKVWMTMLPPGSLTPMSSWICTLAVARMTCKQIVEDEWKSTALSNHHPSVRQLDRYSDIANSRDS